MPAIDYSDENLIKEELRKLVHREMASVFAELDRTEAEIRDAAAGLEGSLKEALEANIGKVAEAKLEAIQLFKAMHDFVA